MLQWNSGQLVRLGWSSSEELLCIQENGKVLKYSVYGEYIHAFSMGQVKSYIVGIYNMFVFVDLLTL